MISKGKKSSLESSCPPVHLISAPLALSDLCPMGGAKGTPLLAQISRSLYVALAVQAGTAALLLVTGLTVPTTLSL